MDFLTIFQEWWHMCYAWKIVRNPFAFMVILQSTRKGPNHCWNYVVRVWECNITQPVIKYNIWRRLEPFQIIGSKIQHFCWAVFACLIRCLNLDEMAAGFLYSSIVLILRGGSEQKNKIDMHVFLKCNLRKVLKKKKNNLFKKLHDQYFLNFAVPIAG